MWSYNNDKPSRLLCSPFVLTIQPRGFAVTCRSPAQRWTIIAKTFARIQDKGAGDTHTRQSRVAGTSRPFTAYGTPFQESRPVPTGGTRSRHEADSRDPNPPVRGQGLSAHRNGGQGHRGAIFLGRPLGAMDSGCLGYRAAETRRPMAVPGMKRGGDSENGLGVRVFGIGRDSPQALPGGCGVTDPLSCISIATIR